MTKFNSVLLFCCAFLLASINSSSAQDVQQPNPLLKLYRAFPPKINDLVHTRLDVKFDYKKRFMYGKEWITLKPHCYPTDTLRMDAKYMDLKSIAVLKGGQSVPLKFVYDSLSVAVKLDKVYHNNESYTVYIDYTAKPDTHKGKNGAAVLNDTKGLYFINPDSSEKDKPVQIWTQGEVDNASAWFPTMDVTDQKCTAEINMTVPAKYVTLSNGRLAAQKTNADGTRTDTWKMEHPNAPYLFMMAVGDFKIYHDHWKNTPVDYYLEPKYAPYAKQIFGLTPEAIRFFSKIFNYDYPWNKYAQVVVRDFVIGGMENTTATTLNAYVQETPREMIDAYYNKGQRTIMHELVHQWFGDLVTQKSWSNEAVDETFSEFGDILWTEHKYGKDESDAFANYDLLGYLNTSGANTLELARFRYINQQDMFDAVTYNKGARILKMLRNYLGDEAFFKGIKIYLTNNAYKNGEVTQLRLAWEEAGGQDLNWFFNQWYYGAGHPVLDVNYKWDEAAKTETVYLQQTQAGQLFKLPMAIDVYADGKKERHNIWVKGKADTLIFKTNAKPDLVNIDADKMLVAQINDSKTAEEFAFQYFNAPLYFDRMQALKEAAVTQSDKGSQKVMIAALNDKYYGLRVNAINALDMNNAAIHTAALQVLINTAENDSNSLVKTAAIKVLGKLKNADYLTLFTKTLNSQSYAVQGAALTAINYLDSTKAVAFAKEFEQDNKGALTLSMINIGELPADPQWPYINKYFGGAAMPLKIDLLESYGLLAGRVEKPAYSQQGIAAIKDIGMRSVISRPLVINVLTAIKAMRQKLNDNTSAKAAYDAVMQIMSAI